MPEYSISLEPNIVWKRLVPFFGVVSSQKNDEKKCGHFCRFWPVFGIFTLFDIFVNCYHFFTIFSNFWNFAIICNFLTFFAIFTIFLHLLALFGKYVFECILKHLNPFLAVSAHCINFWSPVENRGIYKISLVRSFVRYGLPQKPLQGFFWFLVWS